MQRQVEQRLGSTHLDGEEVKAHKFFIHINWNDVISRQLEPPFRPQLSSADDVSQFDQLFTGSSPVDSPVDYTLSESADGLFQVSFVLIYTFRLESIIMYTHLVAFLNNVNFLQGFSYVAPSILEDVFLQQPYLNTMSPPSVIKARSPRKATRGFSPRTTHHFHNVHLSNHT